MRWVYWWIIVVLVVVSSCEVSAPSGFVRQRHGNRATFVFRDFRLGMTRGELYEALGAMELTWTGEVWKLPEALYPGLQGVNAQFDDDWGIMPGHMRAGEQATLLKHKLEPYQLDACLVRIVVNFGASEEAPKPIIQACKELFGKNPEETKEEHQSRPSLFQRSIQHLRTVRHTWDNAQHDARATLDVKVDFIVPLMEEYRQGEKLSLVPSFFRTNLELVSHVRAREGLRDIGEGEKRRLGARETQQQADLITGRKTELPDRLPIERNPGNPEPLIGRWIMRTRVKQDSPEEMVCFFHLSRKDGERTVVGSIVGIHESDIFHDKESIHGGLYEQDGARFVILRSVETGKIRTAMILTGERIWGEGWNAYRAPTVPGKTDAPDFSGVLVTQRLLFGRVQEQCYVQLRPLSTEEVGCTYPYHLYTGILEQRSVTGRIVSKPPIEAQAIYKEGVLCIRGNGGRIIFNKVTEKPILELHGDPKAKSQPLNTPKFNNTFKGRRLKDIPKLPPINIGDMGLLVDGKQLWADEAKRIYPNAVGAFGIMFAVPIKKGGYFLLHTVGEPPRWEMKRVESIKELGYVREPKSYSPIQERFMLPIFTAIGVDRREVGSVHIIYPPRMVEAIREAGLRKAGRSFTLRHILDVDPQIEYDTRTRKMQLTARNVRTTHYYRW